METPNFKMSIQFSKYLPSKKFTLIIGIVVGVSLLLFGVFFVFSGKTIFVSDSNQNSLAIENKTILNLIEADTDLDGVPDWEEALWGTDKNKKATFDGVADATYIKNRKKEMQKEEGEAREQKDLTETEKFAREFFQSFVALKASGEVDETTINNFSSALGQKIVNPSLTDPFLKENIKTTQTDTEIDKLNYYLALKNIFDEKKINGLGKELQIISEGLVNTSPEIHAELSLVSQAYQDFAKEIMEITVPESLKDHHLEIANSAHKTGLAIANMQQMILDPITGLVGLSEYQKYSEDFIKSVSALEAVL